MLEKKYSSLFSYQCYLVQYSQDGSQILSTRELNYKAEVITAVETSVGKKLVVGTRDTHTLYMCDIIKEDWNDLKMGRFSEFHNQPIGKGL